MNILNRKSLFLLMLVFMGINVAFSHINPKQNKGKKTINTTINFREDCTPPKAQIDLAVNNVRSRLTSGGDVWWDQEDGKYVVPVPAPGEPEVSSIFAGAVWIGGRDAAGNLKLAATTYRDGSSLDFYSGPLDDNGVTDLEVCLDWDRFFKVEGSNIDKHIKNYKIAEIAGVPYDCDSIPDDVKYWPGRGNEFFTEKYDFELPDNKQGLGSFHDSDEDGYYEPCDGEYPIIEIRGCPDNVYPDEMLFWIYNDNGGVHSESQGSPIQMEVQVQAFGWATNDEINDMTFQRYKLINRAISDIRDCYFAMWIDPDLGCHTDDYIGCVVENDLMYVYNQDKLDGTDGCTCDNGVNTYCDRIPILGVDYFRGPLAPRIFDEDGNPTITPEIGVDGDTLIELGMNSFIYYNNGGIGSHPNATTDPDFAPEYYNYLQGLWKDGTAITFGGSGFNLGSDDSVKYVFPNEPNDQNGWSMFQEQLGFGDRRTIQATGPFLLEPGAVNELIIGVPWVPNQLYPAPDLDELLVADELAQTLFNNCFELQDGPDAPDIDLVELDKELVLILTNDEFTSNNAFEQYREKGLKISEDDTEDIFYVFEGYQIYQLSSANVTVQELDEFEKARLIYQVDVKNDVTTLYNWTSMSNPSPGGGSEIIFTPTKKVSASNEGIKHVFKVSEDQFASENRRLVNHKTYYFLAIAYGWNNWNEFNPSNSVGQREPYFAGRKNIKTYTAIPRPLPYVNLNANVDDGIPMLRLDGTGNGDNFIVLDSMEHDNILAGKDPASPLAYARGGGPVNVQVFNPLGLGNKKFRLDIYDEDMANDELDDEVRWKLTLTESEDEDDVIGKEYLSESIINVTNQQIIYGEGFAVTVDQVANPGTLSTEENGVVGSTLEYDDPDGETWMRIIRDDMGYVVFGQDLTNFIKTGEGEFDNKYDPEKAFSNIGDAPFVPFWLTDFQDGFYVTPGFKQDKGHDIFRKQNGNTFEKLYERNGRLNNVDIVFTSDKSKWSRCIITEAATTEYLENGEIEGDVIQFDLRQGNSVGKEDADGDGLADEDGDGVGMGWFPGYAIDVESGQRVNIFFSENSTYGGVEFIDTLFAGKKGIGRDMMFNPTNDDIIASPEGVQDFSIWNAAFGGQHFVYVTNTPYDECAALREGLTDKTKAQKAKALNFVTWTALVMNNLEEMLPYSEGLIPNDAKIQIRVANPYAVETFAGNNAGYGSYEFDLNGMMPDAVGTDEEDNPLNMVNVAPNPYYAYSPYETSQFTQKVKITNLPGECTVTIYSMDGKFIRQFKRDEVGVDYAYRSNPAIDQGQIFPDIDWDMKNSRGIPISSGVYLIHIQSDDLNAERTIKWFGINRKFDPTGL